MKYKWQNRTENIKGVEDFARNVLTKWEINMTLEEIYDMYNKPHRYFHNVENHLLSMLCRIYDANYKYVDDSVVEELFIAALFHDIIYEPNTMNELESSKFLLSKLSGEEKDFSRIIKAINDTETHDVLNESLTKDNIVSYLLCDADVYALRFGSLKDLITVEKLLFKEYQRHNYVEYKKGRIEFIKSYMKKFDIINGDKLIEYIKSYKPNIAVYAGSFNPFHKGHYDILQKSEKIFDKVIVAKGRNDSKNIDEEQFKNEFENLQKTLPHREVVEFSGLLTNFISEHESYANITLIRGLRNGYDLEAENTLMSYMRDQKPDINVVYIPCDKKYEHISSSAIRSIRKHGDEYVKDYLLT